MSDPRHALGRDGERLAEDHLRRRGLRPVARRYATPVGELDLVMRDGDTVVFVEVKTRSSRTHADPQDAVNYTKQRKLGRCAAWFVHHKRWTDRPCRFDVVAIIAAPPAAPSGDPAPPTAPPEIEWFKDAFIPR